jgi:hypothetical protein
MLYQLAGTAELISTKSVQVLFRTFVEWFHSVGAPLPPPMTDNTVTDSNGGGGVASQRHLEEAEWCPSESGYAL